MSELYDNTLEMIVAFTNARGYPPSRRELAESLGVNVSTVQARLERMVREGLIEVDPVAARGIRVKMKAQTEEV